ncbi:MAG: excinuclease ABC subunit UvrC [Fibrobacter sp.]|jgi:excinuclease ABC subunit C|nr:excinuclease ABC subunit UvrC [Fibrobacter sp.]
MDYSNTIRKKLDQSIFDQLNRFPESPGVYIMKDETDKVLYIGKAINLRNRVRSYFSDSHEDRAHIPVMLQKLDHIDWIATNNETEALILEANLIRTHQPNYNVKLRDDSHFPYLKVTVNEPFPRLLVVRKVEKDGARYFGPYTDVRSMRRLAAFAKKIFRLRDCSKQLPLSKPVRPCINYSMKRCSGPCDGKVSQENYRNNVSDLIRFLSGKRNDLIRDLTQSMEKASEEYRFEDAAVLRDQIQLIKDASRLQQVDLKLADTDCDVFGIAEGDRTVSLAVLHFRDGLLISSRNYLFKRTTWEFSNTNHDNILLQFYQEQQDNPPPEILLPENGGFEQEILQNWFNQQFSSKTTILIPQKGTKKILVGMAEKNASLYMAQKAPVSAIDDIIDLQKVLCLPKIPEVIEAFDISNLGESFTVAGMVQFKDGMPNKSGYRRYKIKTVDGQNDFAMMMEVVSRRLCRLQEENKPFPDLLLIDGGPGQLSSALDAIKQFQNPPLVASLAKREEILYSPCVSEPIRLPPTHPARRLVERIRDEVHRYAITYHRKIRGKQFGRSILEDVEGIGKKSAQLLLKKFGSLERLKNASIEEIAEINGFSEAKARKLKDALSQREINRE